MMNRRTFVAALGAAVAVPSLSRASTGVLTATEAHEAIKAGTLLLVDIRRPEEWQQTGVAAGAWPVDMRRRDFGPILMAMIERNPNHKVALICRTGNRSGYLMKVLKENNIHGVLDVSEGMAGGPNGKGWIKTGLPIVTAQEAVSGIPQDLAAG